MKIKKVVFLIIADNFGLIIMVEHLPDIVEEGICIPQKKNFFNAEINANTYDTSYSNKEPTLKGIQKRSLCKKGFNFWKNNIVVWFKMWRKSKAIWRQTAKTCLERLLKTAFSSRLFLLFFVYFLRGFPLLVVPNT